MTMTKVKVCGITNEEDALMAVNYGADAIGMIINVPVETPRKIDIEKAKKIMDRLPPFISTVIVLMPDSLRGVKEIVNKLNPCAVQLHGHESLDFISKIKERVDVKIIKTVHIDLGKKTKQEQIKEAERYSKIADAILLDTKINEREGGTGKTHDWKISSKIRDLIKTKPLILSGGLNPENVKVAIKTVRPYAVDASSGIESKPGKKDIEKMRRFIKIAKKNEAS